MHINRNNYEEYFLLYADKELSAEEKSMVEKFVQQNPDVEEEFIMLQQTIAAPDNTIAFENKSILFREEPLLQTAFINQHNYEEKFLLYYDNELSLSEINEMEIFLQLNPALQNEFTLLQQIKYEPDVSIAFPDKNILYKKESTGKIIPFRWKSVAAAILLVMGLWGGITYLFVRPDHQDGQKNKTAPVIVINKTTLKQAKPTEIKNISLAKTADNKLTPLQKKVNNHSIKSPSQKNIIVKNNHQADKKPEENKIGEQKNEDIAINNLPEKNKVATAYELLKPKKMTEPDDKAETVISLQNMYAQPASYVADAEVKSENYVFYNITAEEFRKSKIGNFLKKVKSAIEKRNPLKNKRFRIGNIEIAKDQN